MLKNHRNDSFTRLSRSTARTTHAYKKSREAHQKKEALNVVDEELVSLKNVQKENAARIKELKATKADIALTKHGKTTSSKAESSSSGRVTGVSRRTKVKAALKVATVKKGTSHLYVFTLES